MDSISEKQAATDIAIMEAGIGKDRKSATAVGGVNGTGRNPRLKTNKTSNVPSPGFPHLLSFLRRARFIWSFALTVGFCIIVATLAL